MSTENPFAQSAARIAAVARELRETLPVAYGLATGEVRYTQERGRISEAVETKVARELRAAHGHAIRYMLDKYAWIDVARLAIRLLGAESGLQARVESAESALSRVEALCQDTDGNWLDPEDECNNVGSIMHAVRGGGA